MIIIIAKNVSKRYQKEPDTKETARNIRHDIVINSNIKEYFRNFNSSS
jgi:hypothetical protein